MSTATLERLPNTVTACHAEIKKLRVTLGMTGDAAQSISALESERDELKDKLKEAETERDELDERVEELENHERPDIIPVVQSFLDECERVGPLRYDVPQSDRTNRAIVALHEAVGRTP